MQQTCAAKMLGMSTLHSWAQISSWLTYPWYNYVHACTYSYNTCICYSYVYKHSWYYTYMLFNFVQAWTTEQIQSLVYTTKQLNTIPEKTVSTFNVALISTSLSKIEELKNCLLKCYEHVSVCYWQTACTGKLCSIIIHRHYTFNNLCYTVCANPSVFRLCYNYTLKITTL